MRGVWEYEIRGGSDLGKNVYVIGGVAPSILRNERGSLLRAITRYRVSTWRPRYL